MDSHHRRLGRGFTWLGGATVAAKLVDFATTLVLLLYLSKPQVGVASLVISVGMIVEALNGLGTGEALIQARAASRPQLDTLFWYVLGASGVVAGLTLLAAPWIAALYGVAGMGGYFLASAATQPLGAAAVIPRALMNRDLRYERIATVGVCATAAAAATRLALGAAGAGAWALVAGYAASGLYTLLAAQIARPFRPRLRCRPALIGGLAGFGLRAASANLAEQMFRNVDYLLIGWFYGAAQLALYRVAFDIAMEPAMAVATLVSRTALPVLARVAPVRSQVAEVLAWALGRSAVLVAPLMAALALAAGPLCALLHDHAGHSYAAAAIPLRLLTAAALLRAVSQPLATVLIASGRPGTAARLSATMLLLLASGIVLAGLSVPAQAGIVAAAGVWLAIYPLLLAWGARYLRRDWDIDPASLARAVAVPGGGVAAMAVVVLATRRLLGGGPVIQMELVVAATALVYAGLFLRGRRRGSEQGWALPKSAKRQSPLETPRLETVSDRNRSG